MKQLTHFLDTPKRPEISALLKPLPISSTTCDSRRLSNIGRSSLTTFRLLRFLFIARKSILPETVSNMQYWEIVADKLSAAGWSWGYCSAVTRQAGGGLLTPVPKRIGLKSNIRHSVVLVKVPSITSPDVFNAPWARLNRPQGVGCR